MNFKSKIFKNLLYAFGAQGISLILSVMMSVIVPMLLGIEQYGYWQLFIFYTGYVGFCQFGLQDGMYLRLGGAKYKDLDYSLLGMQLKLSILIQAAVGIIGAVVVFFTVNDGSRQFVWFATIIYMLLSSLAGFLGYIFQATNEIKEYSISVMIDKAIFIIMVAALIITKARNFEMFVLFYLTSKAISTVYCMYVGRKVIFSGTYDISKTFKEMWVNICVGINLMIANIASMLILGIGRMMSDSHWGIAEFGKLSFAFSLMNFILMFVSQISMVLFPALRKFDKEYVKKVYKNITEALAVVLPLAFLAYIPMKVILLELVPKYKVSLNYLALLLPIVTFDGKMNLLCNTYFKVLRKEKFLLKVNLISMILSSILSAIAVYVFDSMIMMVIFMVAAIAFRSIFSEIYLSKLMNHNITMNVIQEVAIASIFMLIAYNMPPLQSFVTFLIIYIFYIFVNFRKLDFIFSRFKAIIKKKN